VLILFKTYKLNTYKTDKVVNSMARRNTSLDPQAREALNRFKIECAKEIGYLQYVKENNDHYKGDVPCRVNGLQGGPIGGQMVKRMIQMAESQLLK
jgi:hypothetical protein